MMSISLLVSETATLLDHVDAITLADQASYLVATATMLALAFSLVVLKLRSH